MSDARSILTGGRLAHCPRRGQTASRVTEPRGFFRGEGARVATARSWQKGKLTRRRGRRAFGIYREELGRSDWRSQLSAGSLRGVHFISLELWDCLLRG